MSESIKSVPYRIWIKAVFPPQALGRVFDKLFCGKFTKSYLHFVTINMEQKLLHLRKKLQQWTKKEKKCWKETKKNPTEIVKQQ